MMLCVTLSLPRSTLCSGPASQSTYYYQATLYANKYIKLMNIKTDDICKQEFENLKYHKNNARYIIYHINKELIVRVH